MKRQGWLKKQALMTVLGAVLCVLLFPVTAPAAAAATESSLQTVYVDGKSDGSGGDDSNDGSEDSPVFSLGEALRLVQPGGNIYVKNSLYVSSGTYDGKGAHLFPEASMIDSLILLQNNADVTIMDLDIDGSTRGPGYYYDILYADSGSLTLEGVTVQNFQNMSYGAAVGIYSGATVTLKNGSSVINNHGGTNSDAHVGGIAVGGGTLFLDGATVTGNTTYASQSRALDIYASSDSEIHLNGTGNGGNEVGTIAFSLDWTGNKVIDVSAPILSPVNMRLQKYFSPTIPLFDLSLGNLLAEGDGYELTEEDRANMVIPSPNLFVVKLNESNQAYVAGKPYNITLDPNMTDGTLTFESPVSYTDTATLTLVPNPGYKPVTISAYEVGTPNSQVQLSKGAEPWTYTMKMPKHDVVVTNTTPRGKTAETISNTCAVKIGKKIIEVQHPEDFKATVEDPEQLLDAALTEEEKEKITQGENVAVYLKINPIEPNEDKPYVEEALEGKQLGQYVDISLLKKIGEQQEQHVSESQKLLKITVEIPENLRAQNRTFYFLRVHKLKDGTVQKDLLKDLDNDPNTITIESDRFSTYALLYAVTKENGGSSAPSSAGSGASSGTVSSPATGDGGIAPAFPALFGVFAAAAAVLCVRRIRARG